MGDLAPLYHRELLNYKDLHRIFTSTKGGADRGKEDQDVKGFLPSICREESAHRLQTSRRASQTRMEHVSMKPLSGNRYYSSIATQTGEELGLPAILPTMSYDDQAMFDVGTQSARPASGRANTYYQRLMQTDQVHPEPQTARPAPPEEPRAVQNKFRDDPGPPIFRAGRMGAPWRHVRQCLGNLGNHICFVDGYVKEHDMKYYPPYGYVRPTEAHTYISPRLNTAAGNERKPQPKHGNKYSNHAKKGFKYWHDDKPIESGAPKQTIQGRLMKTGVGY